jgi:hypothetical protein
MRHTNRPDTSRGMAPINRENLGSRETQLSKNTSRTRLKLNLFWMGILGLALSMGIVAVDNAKNAKSNEDIATKADQKPEKNNEENKAKEKYAEEYLGTYEIKIERSSVKYYLRATLEKLKTDKPQPNKTISVGKTKAKLIIPVQINAKYDIQVPWWIPGYESKSGNKSISGGIYDNNGQDLIVPKIKQNIAIKIRKHNNLIQIFYDKWNEWVDMEKVSN